MMTYVLLGIIWLFTLVAAFSFGTHYGWVNCIAAINRQLTISEQKRKVSALRPS